MILTDVLKLGTNKKVWSQGILMCNMKAFNLTSHEILLILKFLGTIKRTDGQADRRTGQKLNAPDLLMGRHKNTKPSQYENLFL